MAGPKTDFQVLNFKAVTVLSIFKVGPRYRKRLLAGETSQLPGGFRPRQARFRLYLLPTPQSAKTALDWKLHVRWGALNKITQPMAGLDVAFGKRGEQSTKVSLLRLCKPGFVPSPGHVKLSPHPRSDFSRLTPCRSSIMRMRVVTSMSEFLVFQMGLRVDEKCA